MNRANMTMVAIGWFFVVAVLTVILSLRLGVLESGGFFIGGSVISVALLFLVPQLPPARQSRGNYYDHSDNRTYNINYNVPPIEERQGTGELEILEERSRQLARELEELDRVPTLAPPVRYRVSLEAPEEVKQLKSGGKR